ncbi:MAG TPA: hypothetical protein VF530_23200 [Planctomycetota bacterium]
MALPALLLAGLGACRTSPGPRRPSSAQELEPLAPALRAELEDPGFPLSWQVGQVLLQGFGGVKYLSDFRLDGNGSGPIELDEDEVEVLPMVGGGAQWKLTGRAFDLGLEGFLSFAGRSDLEAFAAGGGGAVVAIDVNLLLFEAYGGVFASRFLGERVRLHGGVGPLLSWVSYDPDDDDGGSGDDADGSGGGAYARAGLEFLLPSGRLAGLGVRWSESSIDLGRELGDLELGALELFVSYSYGYQPRRSYVGF